MIFSKKNNINGIIYMSGDKSITHRALIISSICENKTLINNISLCDDCLTTINCLKTLGIKVDIDNNNATIYGKGLHGFKNNTNLYTANSGTTTKLLIAILSAQGKEAYINGDLTLNKRNISDLTNILKKMNLNIVLNKNKFCPVKINYNNTKIKGLKYNLRIASAQTKSGLLLAGLYSNQKLTIYEKFQTRNHTEKMLKKFQVNIKTKKNCIILNNHYNNIHSSILNIPGDISSASFFMVLGLLAKNSCIQIKNIGINNTRIGIINIIKNMGGNIQITNLKNNYEPTCDIIVKSSKLYGTYINKKLINTLIDEIPILAILASFAEGCTIIQNAEMLKNKESNRILSIFTELKKAGAKILKLNDGMVIFGQPKLYGNVFNSHNDHRIVMSMVILSLLCEGESFIEDIHLIKISYPNFLNDLFSLIN